MFVECSIMNRCLRDLSHPSMTIVARHRTNPQSRELRPVAVEGGKVGRKYSRLAMVDLPRGKNLLGVVYGEEFIGRKGKYEQNKAFARCTRRPIGCRSV